jgi:predicted membrane protein
MSPTTQEEDTMENRKSFFDFKVFIGLIVLLYGLLLLMRNMGYDFGVKIWEYWPVLLILFGLRLLVQPRENRQFITGLAIAVAGLVLLLNNLDVIDLRWRLIWPLLIIFVGIAMLYNSVWKRNSMRSGQDRIDLSMVFGGGEFRFDSKALRGGSISAIMGGGSVDLRDADMAGDEMALDASAIMGGIELMVPNHWTVIFQATPILGGIDNKSVIGGPQQGKPSKRLVITGTAIMGGIEIKN